MNLFPVGVLPDERFPLLLVAHEIGHSWWGNLVGSDQGAILTEGLAQTSAALTLRELEGEEAMRSYLRRGRPDYGQSAREYFTRFAGEGAPDRALGSAEVGADAASALHDLADTKGVCVYAMLRDEVGPEAFRQGLRDLIRSFGGKRVVLSDLQAAMAKASGKDLERFFRQWFFRTGAAELALRSSIEPADGGFAITGTIEQAGEPYALDVEVALGFEGRAERRIVRVDGASTAFSLRSAERPVFVALDPDEKILRWTAERRSATLLREGAALLGLGKHDEAAEKLQAVVAKAPDSLRARCQLGLLHQEVGDLARAEECFRFVMERSKALGIYEPAVGASALHLGQVLDLAGRREEAVQAYRAALELPDESGTRKSAEEGLAAPYVRAPRSAAPDAAALARFAGTFDNERGLVFVVAVNDQGVLTLKQPDGPLFPLVWIEGARFRVAGSDESRIEFVGAEAITSADLTLGGDVIHVPRKP